MELIRNYIVEEKLDGKNRKTEKVYKRSYLYAYLRYTHNMRLEQIGCLFNRHHASVIHGIEIYNIFKNDKYYLEKIEDTKKEFPMGITQINGLHTLMYQILEKQNELIQKIK